MRKEYDFSKGAPNPYAKKLKRSVTIRLETETIRYFKRLASDTGMPYQTLINLYLRDCAVSRRRLRLTWMPKAASGEPPKKTPRP
jgi:predicted DNA binding CopG/RHH family protein